MVTMLTLLGLVILPFVGYKVVAFLLLLGVSALAMFLDIIPVLMAATLSAVVWDYLFIPPRFTLTVGTADDRVLLFTYFLVALINAVLTHRIRLIEKDAKLKDERAQSVKLYNTLLNSLSHELRTPITTILGSADNLQTNGSRLREADKEELISEISIAAIRLNQQVENLLNMSRLESGFFQIKKDWTDLHDLINKSVQRLESNLQNFEAHIHIPEDVPLFKLDFGLMEQVVYNLLLNVTQHTPEHTQIDISVATHYHGMSITVADNGPGFPPNEIENVFDKFYRVKGSSTGGTGLGLSIVKGFVEAHGGRIELFNQPTSGARFEITIPAESSPFTRLKDE